MVDFQSRDTRRGRDDGTADGAESGDGDADDGDTTDGADETPAQERGDDEAPDRGVAVVSIGSQLTIEQDAAGDAVVEEIDRGGGHVVTREVIDASFDGVQKTIDSLATRRDVEVIVTTGGTSVEPRDVTIEAVRPMLDKHLPGFGELFRQTCREQVGSAVIRTRASAGVVDGVATFSLPGDADLARKGARDIVVPEAETVASLARGEES